MRPTDKDQRTDAQIVAANTVHFIKIAAIIFVVMAALGSFLNNQVFFSVFVFSIFFLVIGARVWDAVKPDRPNPAVVCPHCNTKGTVHFNRATVKAGVLRTATVTRASCDNCRVSWSI